MLLYKYFNKHEENYVIILYKVITKMKNYNELFQNRFKKSQVIDEKFAELSNTEGLESGINYLKQIGATKLDMDNYDIKYRISEWTSNKLSNHEKINFLNELKNLKDYVIDVNIETNDKFNLPEVIVKTTDGAIRAIQFSSVVPKVKEMFPFIENNQRWGKCFEFAYYISMNLGLSNEIVIGYIYGYSDQSKFLHSWVETTIKGEKYVIDGTLNAMINKQGYYLMQHAKPITIISDSVLKKDIDDYLEKIQSIPLEVYYVFRNEIINDLEKNQEIFKK